MIDHQPHECNAKAQNQSLADVRGGQSPLHLLSEILRAYEGGDDHHEKRKHDGLIQADGDRRERHGKPDFPKFLPAGRTAHVRGFQQVRRHGSQPFDRISNNRHKAENDDGPDRGDVVDAEKHDDRNEIDEARKGLGGVADEKKPFRPEIRLRCPDAERQPDRQRHEDRETDHVGRDHRAVPPPGHRDQADISYADQSRSKRSHEPSQPCQQCDDRRVRQPKIGVAHRNEHLLDQECAKRLRHGIGNSDEPIDPGVDLLVERQGLAALDLVRNRPELGRDKSGRGERRPNDQEAVPLMPRRALREMSRLLHHPCLRASVEHDGDKHDRYADFNRAADLQRLQQLQQLLSESRHSDEACEHDHRQALHDDLVDAEQYLRPGGRHPDMPKQLPAVRAAHLSALHDLRRYLLHAEQRHPDHRRGRENYRDDRACLGTDSDEYHHRDHVSEMRQRLRYVQ